MCIFLIMVNIVRSEKVFACLCYTIFFISEAFAMLSRKNIAYHYFMLPLFFQLLHVEYYKNSSLNKYQMRYEQM